MGLFLKAIIQNELENSRLRQTGINCWSKAHNRKLTARRNLS